MATTKFIIIATIAFVALAPTVMSETCRFKKDPKNPGKAACRACKKCKPEVAEDPFTPPNKKSCLPIIEQLTPLDAKVNLCPALKPVDSLVGPILKNITIENLCIDIYWNDLLNCGVKDPTQVSLELKDCILHINVDGVDNAIKCITLSICSIVLDLLGDGSSSSEGLLGVL